MLPNRFAYTFGADCLMSNLHTVRFPAVSFPDIHLTASRRKREEKKTEKKTLTVSETVHVTRTETNAGTRWSMETYIVPTRSFIMFIFVGLLRIIGPKKLSVSIRISYYFLMATAHYYSTTPTTENLPRITHVIFIFFDVDRINVKCLFTANIKKKPLLA